MQMIFKLPFTYSKPYDVLNLFYFQFIEPVYKNLTCVLGYVIRTTLCSTYIYVRFVTALTACLDSFQMFWQSSFLFQLIIYVVPHNNWYFGMFTGNYG